MCLVGDFFSVEALYESGIRLPFSVVLFFRIGRPPAINTLIYTVSFRLITLLFIYWLFLKGTLILCLRLFGLFSYIWIGFWKLVNLTCCLSCINFVYCLSVSWFFGCNLLILCCNVFLSLPDISSSSFLLKRSHNLADHSFFVHVVFFCIEKLTFICLVQVLLGLMLANSLDSCYCLWPFMFR